MKRWQFPCTVPQLRFSSEIRNCPNILKSTRRFPPQGTVMKHCTHRRKQHYAKREVPAIRRCASGLNLFRHGVFANPDLPPTLQLGIAAALRGQSDYSATTTPVGPKGFELLLKNGIGDPSLAFSASICSGKEYLQKLPNKPTANTDGPYAEVVPQLQPQWAPRVSKYF